MACQRHYSVGSKQIFCSHEGQPSQNKATFIRPWGCSDSGSLGQAGIEMLTCTSVSRACTCSSVQQWLGSQLQLCIGQQRILPSLAGTALQLCFQSNSIHAQTWIMPLGATPFFFLQFPRCREPLQTLQGSMPGDGPKLGPYPKVISLVLHFRKLLKCLGEQRYSTDLL